MFLTVERPGDRTRKTSEKEDQDVRTLALERNWDNIDRLRESDIFQESESLSAVSDTTIRRRLSDQGKCKLIIKLNNFVDGLHRVKKKSSCSQRSTQRVP